LRESRKNNRVKGVVIKEGEQALPSGGNF